MAQLGAFPSSTRDSITWRTFSAWEQAMGDDVGRGVRFEFDLQADVLAAMRFHQADAGMDRVFHLDAAATVIWMVIASALSWLRISTPGQFAG